MPRLGFDPTIPVFERAKTVHALDRAATVIGDIKNMQTCKCDSVSHAPITKHGKHFIMVHRSTLPSKTCALSFN
jgi:hypothetical protein